MKLSERIPRWLKALFSGKSEEKVVLGVEKEPFERKDVLLPDDPVSLGFPVIERKLQVLHETLSAEDRVPASTVAEFQGLIQRLFDEEQQKTDPWIKLGIDLGTSSSKVVWRGESDAFPVCFGGDESLLDSYLMPSIFGIEGGKIVTGFTAASGKNKDTIANFKMCLACVANENSKCNANKCSLNGGWRAGLFEKSLIGNEVKFVNAVFLAKLLSETREVITNKLTRTFRQPPRPKWTAILSVPETFIEDSPIASAFSEVFRIAWLMSNVFNRFPEFNDLKLVTKCYLAARKIAAKSFQVLEDQTFGCSIYPEVGAEVASIVMNKNSEEGLYAFVDIGAGTIDASLFNYFRDGARPNRPPFATEISKDLGAAHIEIYASAASEHSKAGFFSVGELKKIKEEYNQMTSSEKSAVEPQFRVIRYVAGEIGKESEKFLTEVFRDARDKKYPGIVNEKIRLVLGGGGASLKTYQAAATKAFTSKHSTNPRPPEVTVLRKPEKFQMSPLPSEEFHRFAVAYGLSFPLEDLPEHILVRDVDMVSRPKQHDWSFNPIYD